MSESLILFKPMDRTAPPDGTVSLLEVARRMGLPLPATCGGKGRCGKCRIIIESSDPAVPEPGETETAALGHLIQQGYRLACEIQAGFSGVITLPEESRAAGTVILTSHAGHDFSGDLHPALEICSVCVPAPDVSAPLADQERLQKALETTWGMQIVRTEIGVLRCMADILRQYPQKVGAVVRQGGEVVELRAPQDRRLWGLALDLGTTTMVGYLMDLTCGSKEAVRSALNPQAVFGADVISRIAHCQAKTDGQSQLTDAVRKGLGALIADLCMEAAIRPEQLLEAVVVGNTAMHHLFAGLNPRYLAMAPYPPVVSAAQYIPARELDLPMAPSARVYLPPIKAGFVGSDTTAGILATRLHHCETPTLLVDLGTNGELALAAEGRLACCSTAAGPAFEGGHIQWGMRAAAGAIERVEIDSATLEVTVQTIDHQPPAGICGSGLIAAVAALIRAGVLGAAGQFLPNRSHPRLRVGPDGWEFVLVWAANAGVKADIVLRQRDIAELLMAKAAIHAGAALLLEHLQSEPPTDILMAGACGNYVDPRDARWIDLLPHIHNARLTGVGNAAGHGACMFLLDATRRAEIDRVIARTEYLELAANPRFQELFVSGMFFSQAVDYRPDF